MSDWRLLYLLLGGVCSFVGFFNAVKCYEGAMMVFEGDHFLAAILYLVVGFFLLSLGILGDAFTPKGRKTE